MRSLPPLPGGPGFLLVAGLIVFFQNAWRPGLFTEGLLYSAFARNVLEDGRWLIPHLAPDHLDRFVENPPFYFLYVAGVFALLGASWTTARLAAVLVSLAAVLALWDQLRAAGREREGFLAGLLLILCIPFVKAARYPNMDVPLLLFGTLALFTAYRATRDGRLRLWWLAGLWLGLAALSKGVFAAFVPLAVLVWLVISGNLRALLTPGPWLGLATGVALFAVWPLCLWLDGNLDCFLAYRDHIFQKSLDADLTGRTHYKYVKSLLTVGLPTLLLAGGGLWVTVRARDRGHHGWLYVAWALAVWVPLEIVEVERAHWLLGIYPALCGLGAVALRALPARAVDRGTQIVQYLLVVVGLVFACLPVATDIVRDRPLHRTVELVDRLRHKPDAIVLVADTVAVGRFLSILEFATDYTGQRRRASDLEAWLRAPQSAAERRVIVAEPRQIADLPGRLADTLKARYLPLVHFERWKLVVLVDRRLTGDGPLLNEP